MGTENANAPLLPAEKRFMAGTWFACGYPFSA
jgi:hypothetical protein